MNSEFNILLDQELGKIEDAGELVEGGRIDKYWQKEGTEVDTRTYIGTSFIESRAWVYDSEMAKLHFDLRSVEFGNWMSQEDRANFLVV